MRLPGVFLLVTLLCGCAGPYRAAGRLPGVPVPPPPPAGIVHQEATFQVKDGTHVFWQSWRPASPKAVVVIVHGLKDHGDHYAVEALSLASAGYAVYAADLRGHGNSEGERVWVRHFEEYRSDLGEFLARVKAADPGHPLFLFGHSMGGAIVVSYVLAHPDDQTGFILSGPALKLPPDIGSFKVSMISGVAAIFPHLHVLSLPDKDFSRDPAVVAGMAKDPLIFDGDGPARTAVELLHTMQDIEKHMEEVRSPFLVMHGTADKATNPEGSKDLVRRAGATDKTLKLYDGFYHDLLHEPDHSQVVVDIQAWLDAHCANPGSPPPRPSAP
jgi:acylglycerol lipase